MNAVQSGVALRQMQDGKNVNAPQNKSALPATEQGFVPLSIEGGLSSNKFQSRLGILKVK